MLNQEKLYSVVQNYKKCDICFVTDDTKPREPNSGMLEKMTQHHFNVTWIKLKFSQEGYYINSYVNLNPASDATCNA
jgi:hypothetical protein